MKAKNWFWTGIEAVLWYSFIYCLIYTIKNPVNLFLSALVLLVLLYLAILACPWFRHTEAWKRMWKED